MEQPGKKQNLEEQKGDCCKQKSVSVEASKPESEEQKLIASGDTTITDEELSDEDTEVSYDLDDFYDGKPLDPIIDGYSDDEQRDRDLTKYKQQLRESGGFHVDYFPKFRLMGMLIPIGYCKTVHRLTLEAIKSYNQRTGGKYKFERVLRATGSPCQGMLYYITYLAKEGEEEEGENIDDEIKKYESGPEDEIEVDDGDDDGTSKIGDITVDLEKGAKIFEAQVYWEIPSGKAEVHYCELKKEQAIRDC